MLRAGHGPGRRLDLLALLFGLAITAGFGALDWASDSIVIVSVVLAPFVTALLAGHRETVVVAAAATGIAAASGAWNGDPDNEYALRLAVVAGGGAISVLAARGRERAAAMRARFDLLGAMARVADGTLDAEEAVQRVMDLVVPEFADLCTLDLLVDGQQRHIDARVAGPGAEEAEAALMRRLTSEEHAGTARAVQTGEDHLVADAPPELVARIAADEDDRRVLLGLGLRSTMFVALRARGRLIGALGLAVGPSGRRFDESDLSFARTLAGRVALALDNTFLTREVSDLERQLEIALAGLAEAVTVTAPDGRIVYANRAAVALLHAASAEELYAAEPGSTMKRFEVYDEHGRRITGAELPAARLLAGEEAVAPLLVRNVVRESGEERWLLNTASAARDERGRVLRIVNVIEDITEVKRAELSSRLLAEASRALASSLDYEDTLQRVAELAVPTLADWCAVSLPDGRGQISQVAVAHSDPRKVELARRLTARYPTQADAPHGTALVIREGVTQMRNEITAEELAAAAQDPEHLMILRSLGLHSGLTVPMTAGGRTIGAITLVSAESARSFSDADVALAEELARRAGTAVENARLYQERSHIARTLQEGLLPPEMPWIEGWSSAALYRPAGKESDVGGDFYDAFEVPGGWMLTVGDVAGHGAEAAALTALARYTLRTAGQLTGDPTIALSRLNAALRERPELALCTAVCVKFELRPGGGAEASLACAGHPLPLLVRDGDVREVGATGTMAGVVDEDAFGIARLVLEPDDVLVLYTDGVPDTVGTDGRFGDERIVRALREAPPGAAAIIRELSQRLLAFQHEEQRDDTAVVAVQLLGVPAAAGVGAPPAGSAAA